MSLYGQDPEAQLLSRLINRLDHRSVVDVGAERGNLAAELLQAGTEELHVFEPHPENVQILRARFHSDARVTVHECAVSNTDGKGELHVSVDPAGANLPFGHTLLARQDTDEIAWGETLAVTRRSLGSVVSMGEMPSRVGVLKIDTEGHDLAVVQGMGTLRADLIMVEHWTDLPRGLGVCPWTTAEMVEALNGRGFTHFAFIVHRGEFVTLKWDDGDVEPGAMGNLVFLHDDVVSRLLPDVIECAGLLAEKAVRVGQGYMQVASERLAVIHELGQAAQERLQALEETTAAMKEQAAELELLRSRMGAGRSN